MRTTLFTLAGVALLLAIAFDVYATVLDASARFGPVGETLNRTVWRMARPVAFRLRRAHRHRLLNAVGPLLLPLLVAIYVALLVNAFALIYYPRMPEHFSLGDTALTGGWETSLYYSGVTLTTLGYGDIVPRTAATRWAAVFEAASGLALFTLAITYLLTVYTALERKRAVTLSVYHQAGEGADAAGFIAHHFVGGQFHGLREAMRQATRDLHRLLEAHVEHPVIHYFHPLEVYKSLPRMLFVLLEACAVARSCLDRGEYADLQNYPEVRTLDASARHVLGELVGSLDLERRAYRRGENSAEQVERWENRYRQTVRELKARGIRTRPDETAGWEEYRAQREEWESKLRRLSYHLGYDWDEVTGDRDPDYAADEQKEEPQAAGGQGGTL